MARAECDACHFVFPVIDAALRDTAFDIVCPQCGMPVSRSRVSSKTDDTDGAAPPSDGAPRPRSLWDVMQAASARGTAAGDRAAKPVVPTSGDEAAGTPAPPRFDVGDARSPSDGTRTEGEQTSAGSVEPKAAGPQTPDPWAQQTGQPAGPAMPPAEPPVPFAGAPMPGSSATDDSHAVATSEALPAAPTDMPRQRVMQRLERLQRLAERRAVWAMRVGLVGLVLCPLALWGMAWTPYPAGIVGIVAVTLGLSVLFGRGLRRLSRGYVCRAACGLAAGLVAMFAGPLWLQGLGQRHAAEQNQRVAIAHLKQIGAALDAYLDTHGHFPAGGVFLMREDAAIPMHGWMTALLPYLGHQTLYDRVDFERPFDDPVNRPIFERVIPQFTVPDTPVRHTADGLAAAHFAGVGGERIVRERGIVGLGVFGPNSRVTADDVRDGLSQTIVVGQIADALPAWGSADNWREIGAGLNQGHRGFGNSARTGALFLFGDGSVRFFSNRTPRELLIRLSTRDGGDGPDLEQLAGEDRP